MPYNYKTELERYRRYYQSLEPLLGKPKSRNYTTVIFSFLAVSLFGWYAIRPTIQTILTLKREIQDKTDINQKMEDKIANLIQAQAAYSQIEWSLPVIDEALPDSSEAVSLVIQLQNLASSTGVTVIAVQLPAVPLLGSAGSANKDQSFDVSITVSGNYQGLQAFLTGLSEMRRVVVLSSVTLTPEKSQSISASASATPVNPHIQLTLKLTSYYLVE